MWDTWIVTYIPPHPTIDIHDSLFNMIVDFDTKWYKITYGQNSLQLAKRGSLRAYMDMLKFALKLCGILNPNSFNQGNPTNPT